MATIGRLVYQIGADTAQFQKGVTATRKEMRAATAIIQASQTPLERYQKQVKELDRLLQKGGINQRQYNFALRQMRDELRKAGPPASKLSQMFAGFKSRLATLHPALLLVAAGAAAVAVAMRALRSIVRQVSQSFTDLDRVAKVSAKIGIAANDLVALRAAAGQAAGVGVQQLDTALQRLSRRLGQAALGSGEAVKALELLGLKVKDVAGLPLVEQLKVIADAFTGVDSESRRLLIAFKLFDTEGAQLKLLLNQGAAGIEAFRQKARELGVILEDDLFSLATVERYNDALDDLRLAWRGVIDQLVVKLAPVLTVVAERLVEWLRTSQAWRTAMGGAITFIVTHVANLIDQFLLVVGAIRAMNTLVIGAQLQWAKLTVEADKFFARVNPFKSANEDLQAFANALEGAFEQAKEKTAKTFKTALTGGTTRNAIKLLADIKNAADDSAKATGNSFSRALGSVAGGISKLADRFGDAAIKLRQLDNAGRLSKLQDTIKRLSGFNFVKQFVTGRPDDIEAPKPVTPAGANTAILRGSAEAFAEIQARRREQDGDTVDKQQLVTLKSINTGIDRLITAMISDRVDRVTLDPTI